MSKDLFLACERLRILIKDEEFVKAYELSHNKFYTHANWKQLAKKTTVKARS